MDTFDLTGLDSQTAKQIVVQVIQSLKATTAQRVKLDREAELWRNRVKLAQEKGRADLQAEAQTRLGDVEFQLDSLKAEERELIRTVDRMKQQLKVIEGQAEMSVDTDQLLAQLELLDDDKDELAEEFRKQEADALLDKLKEDMKNES